MTKRIEDLIDSEDGQKIIAAQCLYNMTQMLRSPAISDKTRNDVVFSLLQELLHGDLTPESGGDTEEARGEKMETEEEVETEPEKAADTASVRFSKLITEVVEDAKTKKRVVANKKMEEIVDLVENYDGDMKVMNNIKTMIETRDDKKERVAAVRDFVKTLV